MAIGEIIAGQRHKWSLVRKLSEGDAGEVFLVESLLERKTAILKRPYRSTFTSDLLRRASQIRTESRVLRALGNALGATRWTTPVCIPALLDVSQSGDELGEGLFIVIEKASGFDLSSLARAARFGRIEEPGLDGESVEYRPFLDRLAERGGIPQLVLLRALTGLIELFERVHTTAWVDGAARYSGLIWNDVKPEHIYWDPLRGTLTVIDWGNAQFLEQDGASQDRRYSQADDYGQFLAEMGKFLSEADPALYERLEWPAEALRGPAALRGAQALKERLAALLEGALADLRDLRRRESDLLGAAAPAEGHFRKLERVQSRIFDCGEIPDWTGIEGFYSRSAAKLAGEADLEGLRRVCAAAAGMPGTSSEKWFLLDRVAELASGVEEKLQPVYLRALHAGTVEDWPGMLWELLAALPEGIFPDWWDGISQDLRRLHLHVSPDDLAPYIVVSRLFFTFSAVLRTASRPEASPEAGRAPEMVLQVLESEVVKKWKQLEPDPPNAGIGYLEIESLVDEIEAWLPGTRESLEKALAQARAQAEIVMDAWRRKEFETARRGLRSLLVWDPHRRRVLLADAAIQAAPRWLVRVRQGAGNEEAFQDYLIEVELDGRDLRNQVGPSPWLDSILETFKGLRNGARPADLLINRPQLLNDIPWLNEIRSRETLSLPRERLLTLERDASPPAEAPGLRGSREGTLGPGGDLSLAGPLDTWLPEARGSSARVFSGTLGGKIPGAPPVAIKIMRPDQAGYALPLFREEAQILAILHDVPGVAPLLECGFIRLEKGAELPGEVGGASADGLRGGLARYGADSVQNFLASLERQVSAGWLPYLALPQQNQAHNLIVFCDAGHTHGQFLPLRECLLLAVQICDILQFAHDRNIVYRDHKILHYYWDLQAHGVTTIDWNIAKRYPQGLGSADERFDLVQFGARALHHILTGRAAPGALPLGPNRPEEIEQAAHTYRVQWTYDDERLPNRLKEILEQVLTEGYSQVKDLRRDLLEVFQQLPDPQSE